MKRICILVCLVLSLSACTKWWGKDEDYNPYQGMTAKQLLAEAEQAIRKEQYESAAKRLEAMETMYPFSDYAERAQMDLIYAYYKKEDYASAAATAERFIHLYPRSCHVDYVYYMKGLANFQQPRGAFVTTFPIDESWREPGTQAQAYSDFATLIQKFPESRYQANALQRMIYLRNMFASHELNIARYYYQRKMYVAASERASFLIKNYPQAPQAQEALGIVYFASKALNLTMAADEALAVYQTTYHCLPAQLRA